MSKSVLRITTDVQNENLEPVRKYIQWSGEMNHYMFLDMGLEHYKLLSYISKQLPENTIVYDIGTHHGASALALSTNPTITVRTFDIINHIPNFSMSVYNHPQIECKIADCYTEPHFSKLVKANYVFFDIEPHNGTDEILFCERMKSNGFEGIVFFDDIYLNPNMRKFWETVPSDLKKVDLTKYGHKCGTGAVIFNSNKFDIITE